jgi:tetratricopeptide (TPR) repeat protein
MRRARSLVMFLVVVGATACATTRTAGPGGSPDAIARLESARAANPNSEPVLRALGIAYYKAGRLKDARPVLDQATKLNPKDGTVALYLGLVAEGQEDYATARAAYSSYLLVGKTKRVRSELSARLAVVQRKEILKNAKDDLKNEIARGGVSGPTNTVAVLPLTFSGADTSLKPLERGLAELITTDLARSSRLTVLERMRIQAILDEITLQGQGATDPRTGVRAGKILQAGRMVQGSIVQQGAQLRVDAAVIDVPTTQVRGAPVNDDRALDQLLTLEKNIVLGLFQQLGVTLTTAERNAIEQRPTRSLVAFMAYSQGLVAEDAGRFDEANRYYQNAVRLDPSFQAAQQKSAQTQNIITGTQVTAATIERGLAGSQEGRVADQAGAGVASGATESGTAMVTASDLNPPAAGSAANAASGTLTTPSARDPLPDGGGSNLTSRTAKIEIRVRRP